MVGEASGRREFINEQRHVATTHFDTTASTYDDRFGEIAPLNGEFVARLLEVTKPGEAILDAACGTGRFFGLLASRGNPVFGVDQSPEMVALANRKFPEIDTRVVGMQELRFECDLEGRFAAVACIDSLEWIMREDWPSVLESLRWVLGAEAHAYITIEIPGEEDSEALGRTDSPAVPVLEREAKVQDWYNHFPTRSEVLVWLSDAGFSVEYEDRDEWYWHILLRNS